MNILITSQHAGMAGSTYSTAYLAIGLAEQGIKVYVACPEDSLLTQLIKDSSVVHLPFNISRKVDFKRMRQLARWVAAYDIQLINAQSSKDRYLTILARWLHRLPVKLVHTRRQMALSSPLLSGFYQRGTDKNIAVSEGVKQSLIRMGISPDHIEVIYNGTPPDKYQHIDEALTQKLRSRFEIQDHDFVIGCVARKKEQAQLLKAIKKLAGSVKLIFVGIEAQAEYQPLVDALPATHKVHYCGKVANHEVLSYYPLFDVKVLPSTIEGLSQSLLEAMALGIPVVATDLGGNGELIEEGKNGFLFEHKNIDQLAAILHRLQNEPNLRKQMSSKGNKTALKDFSIQNTVNRHVALFSQLIGLAD